MSGQADDRLHDALVNAFTEAKAANPGLTAEEFLAAAKAGIQAPTTVAGAVADTWGELNRRSGIS